jgi:hypothetical protein
MRSLSSKPSVFIIESLGFEDEQKGRLEGEVLRRMLALSGKEAEYRYVRTKQELRVVLEQFQASRLRYLHISCHGDSDGLATTLDDLPFAEFAELVRPYLVKRRLFVSACEAASPKLARHLLPGSGCLSIVGPVGDIRFDDAAVVWAAFYHLMFRLDATRMTAKTIRRVLTNVCRTFDVGMCFFRDGGDGDVCREVISANDGAAIS